MELVKIDRASLWKYRSVHKVLKTNNGKVTKSESMGAYIKKNHIKKLDFDNYMVKPLVVYDLFDEDDDYVELTIFKL